MNIEEFRAKLYQTFIASGMKDHVLIQEYIKIAESFIFNQKQHKKLDQENLNKRLQRSPVNCVQQLVDKEKNKIKEALEVINSSRYGLESIDDIIVRLEKMSQPVLA
jgi:hypothetical protein